MDFEANTIISEQQKLMKKSLLLLISFFLFFITDIILFIIFQKNYLFMFNLNRSESNMPNPFLTDIFATIFYTIILVAFLVYGAFLLIYLNKKYRTNHQLLKKVHGLADFFSIVPIFLFVVIIVNGFFITIGQVDGDSMYPTFHDNDAVAIVFNSEIQREDVLIIKLEEDFLIKRVVGLPGDELVIDVTGVYLNGVLIETYIPYNHISYDQAIPEGYYFLLGDNRTNSLDSRVVGLIAQDDILGEVIHNFSRK